MHIIHSLKRQESEHLNNDISRLETVISRFKNNNEEYLKIKKTVEVSSVLTDGKVLLQFAVASIIEAMRRNPVELNKDCILNLGEKNYENLVEALTNGVINTAVDSS